MIRVCILRRRRILRLSHCLKGTGSFFSGLSLPFPLFFYIHYSIYASLRRVPCLRLDFVDSYLVPLNTLISLFLVLVLFCSICFAGSDIHIHIQLSGHCGICSQRQKLA